jgi:hypothetical protein
MPDGIIRTQIPRRNWMPKAKKKVVKKKVACAAKTKSGKKCKRMVSPPGKFCHLHKK